MAGTQIVDPKANTPTSGRGSGVVSGAAQGAAAGAVAGPVGMIAGAVVGAISGYISGSEQDKAARHATLAYKYASMRQMRMAAVARRNMVRDFRFSRAKAMMMAGSEEGGTRSSAPQGGIASFGAQYGFNINFFDADAWMQSQFQKHSNKAKKHAASANMIASTTSTVFQAASSAYGSSMGWGSTGRVGLPPGSAQGNYGIPQPTYSNPYPSGGAVVAPPAFSGPR